MENIVRGFDPAEIYLSDKLGHTDVLRSIRPLNNLEILLVFKCATSK